jgi:hypothetical protein
MTTVNCISSLAIPSLRASVALMVGTATTSALAALMEERAKKSIKAGQFRKKTDAGNTARATNRAKVKCVKVKGRYHWRNA